MKGARVEVASHGEESEDRHPAAECRTVEEDVDDRDPFDPVRVGPVPRVGPGLRARPFPGERFGARLTIYHALEMPRTGYAGSVDVDDDRRAQWERTVREELSRRTSTLTIAHEVVVEGGLVGGHLLVDLAILDVIHKKRPDLTVMATQRREGFARFFLGSVTAQVVQHAGQPVLRVRKAPHGLVLPYQRILVTTDFSPASRRAFPLAALLARSFEAKVTALHVATTPTLAALAGAPVPPPPHVPSEHDLSRFVQPDFEALPVKVRVRTTGAPWQQIVRTAEEEKTDLIVMSTHGSSSRCLMHLPPARDGPEHETRKARRAGGTIRRQAAVSRGLREAFARPRQCRETLAFRRFGKDRGEHSKPRAVREIPTTRDTAAVTVVTRFFVTG